MFGLFFKKIFLLIGFFTGLLFFGERVVKADEPVFIFSWKSLNFTPQWYEGKGLPINQSKIIVSFEALSTDQNNFGKILDLSDKNVTWFVNNVKVAQGRGLKSIIITKDDFPRKDLDINIRGEYDGLDSFSGNIGSFLYNKRFYIPLMSNPEIVLSYKKSEDFFRVGETIEFELIPFFFNDKSDNLLINWRVNGEKLQSLEENRFFLKLEIIDPPPSGIIVVSGSAENLMNNLERSSKTVIFNAY